MNWLSLIPAALGALGGIFGSNNTSNSTSSTTMSPALTAAANGALTKANTIWQQPYTQYPGERVAAPTAARAAVNPLMGQLTQLIQGNMANGNGAQPRISEMLGRGPGRVSAPTLVPQGGPVATYTTTPGAQ